MAHDLTPLLAALRDIENRGSEIAREISEGAQPPIEDLIGTTITDVGTLAMVVREIVEAIST